MKIGAGCDVFAMPSAPSPFIVAYVSVAVSLACVEGMRCVYVGRFPAVCLPVRRGVQACTLSASRPLCLVLKTTMKGAAGVSVSPSTAPTRRG